jgi:hypothetical protein
MPLIMVLSLCPLPLTFLAWHFGARIDARLRPVRRLLFKCGLGLSILCSLAVLCSWFQPFPLVPDGRGGYSDFRNLAFSEVALVAALVTIGLAVFGRSVARLSLLASGILLTIGAYGALLSRG